MIAVKRAEKPLHKFSIEDIPLKKINKCAQKTVSFVKSVLQSIGKLSPGVKIAFKGVRIFRVIEFSDMVTDLVDIPRTKKPKELPLELFLIVGEIYFLALDVLGGLEAFVFFNFIPAWTDTVAAILAIGDVVMIVKGWTDYSNHKAQIVLIPYLETDEAKAKFLAEFKEKTFDAVRKTFSGTGSILLAVSFFVPGASAVFTLGCVAKSIGGGMALIKLFV